MLRVQLTKRRGDFTLDVDFAAPVPGVTAKHPTTRSEPAAVATNPAGLTARELEVLRLLATGRSTEEIADALFISRRTATTHVGNILGKLGVNTRAAAVAFAHTHSLA